MDPTDPMDSTDLAALARRCHAARTMVASTRDRKDPKVRVSDGLRLKVQKVQKVQTSRIFFRFSSFSAAVSSQLSTCQGSGKWHQDNVDYEA